MGRRRTGRELALQLAYWLDLRGLRPDQVGSGLRSLPILDDETPFAAEKETAPATAGREGPGKEFDDADWEKAKEFAAYLVTGSWGNLAEVDASIARLAEHWVPERMPVVDRNILRLAAFELLFAEDIPPKATINEWIEVAKKYSTESSGAFVNGILDRLHRELPARRAVCSRKDPSGGGSA